MLLAAVAACGPSDFSAPVQPEAWTEVPGARWRPLAVEGGGAGFTAVPPTWSGLDFGNALSDASFLENQMRGNGSGVAAGDVNGDGRPDLYLARLEGPNALYINLGDWRFREAAAESGVAAGGRFSTGATFVDVDGDGDLDLLLTSIEGPTSLFLNDGSGRFTEAAEAGLLDSRGGMSSALADIDGDGDLDLYLTRYKSRSVLDLFPGDEVAFPNTVRRTGREFEVVERFADHYELAWRADGVVRLERGEADELYLNEFDEDGSDGGGFRHVPFSSGAFLDADGAPLGTAPTEWGLAARFGDLDADGDPDLYVANDLHSPDRLWINRGDGTFRPPPPHALPTTSASSMAVDFSDVDRDGDADVFVLDMLARDSRARKTQDPVSRVEHTPPGEAAGGAAGEPQYAARQPRGRHLGGDRTPGGGRGVRVVLVGPLPRCGPGRVRGPPHPERPHPGPDGRGHADLHPRGGPLGRARVHPPVPPAAAAQRGVPEPGREPGSRRWGGRGAWRRSRTCPTGRRWRISTGTETWTRW